MPIFAYHGELDWKLPFKAAFPFILAIKEAGFNIDHHSEKGLGHTMNINGLTKFEEFIARAITKAQSE